MVAKLEHEAEKSWLIEMWELKLQLTVELRSFERCLEEVSSHTESAVWQVYLVRFRVGLTAWRNGLTHGSGRLNGAQILIASRAVRDGSSKGNMYESRSSSSEQDATPCSFGLRMVHFGDLDR
jgi:hypothetical protein